MSGATVLTLSNGRGIDLLAPKATDIDFAVVAEHLAKENRYNGATPGVVYSVAEHSVRGATAALAATGDYALAAYFLVHDAHEAFLKDDTTPKKRAIGALAFEAFGVLATTITASFDLLTDRIDAAVHEAAGLPWPPTPEMKAKIKAWDLIMFVTEWRDLMGGQSHPDWTPYQDIVPLVDPIVPFNRWSGACDGFLASCLCLLPGQGGGEFGEPR
jgi:hypothetical protein